MQHVNIAAPAFEYDETDPPGFRSGMARLGPGFGAVRTGMSVYELPPGQALCPYHWEAAEEEWLLVLEGAPTVRTLDGERVLAPMDVAFFAASPAGAHGVRNASDTVVRVAMFSNHERVTATIYPDSDKVGMWTGDKAYDLMAPRSSAVEYFHGEVGE